VRHKRKEKGRTRKGGGGRVEKGRKMEGEREREEATKDEENKID
jgi:hypothetical protein